MTEKEARMMEKIFNPYNEPIKQVVAELNDVDAHWEMIEAELAQIKS